MDTTQGAKHYMVRVSTGTTRTEPSVFVRGIHANEFGSISFTRTIIAYGSLNTRLVRTCDYLFYCPQGTQALLLKEQDLTERLKFVSLDFKPDSLWASTSFALRVVSCMHEDALAGIKTVRLAGELVPPSARKLLKDKIPHARIVTAYGSSELGNIGSTVFCPFQSDSLYTYFHPDPGVAVDILNPDSEGVGEIAVTKRVDDHELRQHKTGDMGRYIKEVCLCGNPVTFEVLGRKDFDFIKLAGGVLSQGEFDKALNALGVYIRDYRVVAKEDLTNGSIRGEISIQIIPTKQLFDEKKQPEKFLEGEIASRLFVTPTRTLDELVRQGLFLPLCVEFVDSFPQQHKEIKIRKT
jgi:phenylacetate-coenzyme A ligase PaaK-like adenylate-forming protein